MRSLSLASLIFTLTASAQVTETRAQKEQQRDHREDYIQRLTTDDINRIQNRMSTTKLGCIDETCGGDANRPECSDAYSSLYNKRDINISLSLGYTDEKSDVMGGGSYIHSADSLRRQVLEQKMMTPCPPGGVGICGFDVLPTDTDVFVKQVTGPDGQSHTVNIRLTSSAADYYDSNNRRPDIPPKQPCKYLSADVAARTSADQYTQSCRAAKNFFEGLQNADVVIYAGHARLGGGTDYAPPHLIPGTFATNERAYAAGESEKRMLDLLKANPTPPKLIGIFACDAENHFSGQVKAATRGKSAVLSSIGNTAPEVVFDQAYAMLDSVVSMRCEDEFRTELNVIKNAAMKPDRVGGGVDADFTPFFKRVPATAFSEEDSRGANRVTTPMTKESLIHPGTSGSQTQGTDNGAVR